MSDRFAYLGCCTEEERINEGTQDEYAELELVNECKKTLSTMLKTNSTFELDALLESMAGSKYHYHSGVPWDSWHFGKHAEFAASIGMPQLSVLLSAAWQIQHRVHNQDEQSASICREEIREEYTSRLSDSIVIAHDSIHDSTSQPPAATDTAILPDVGCAPGEPYPDFPPSLATFAERRAYQIGVAHGFAIEQHKSSILLMNSNTVPMHSVHIKECAQSLDEVADALEQLCLKHPKIFDELQIRSSLADELGGFACMLRDYAASIKSTDSASQNTVVDMDAPGAFRHVYLHVGTLTEDQRPSENAGDWKKVAAFAGGHEADEYAHNLCNQGFFSKILSVGEYSSEVRHVLNHYSPLAELYFRAHPDQITKPATAPKMK